jgi:hypothetical protein
MPLARLENFLKNLSGNTIYVDPNELDSTDSIENRGNSRTRPFKTIQRALLEAARFSYIPGSNNDTFDQTTILISPGTHYIDNRPGLYYNGSVLKDANNVTKTIVQFSVNTDFNIDNFDNVLYLYNSVDGGVIVPRGVSLVATDLRKTKIRPKYIPDPANDNFPSTAIFKVTGGSYIYGFTIFDGDPLGTVFNTYSTNRVSPSYSHHKLTAFEYADDTNLYTKENVECPFTDLETYYYKLVLAFGPLSGREIPDTTTNLQPTPEENQIVGELGQGVINVQSVISGDGVNASRTITVTTEEDHGLTPFAPIQVSGVGSDSLTAEAEYNGTFIVFQVISTTSFTYLLPNPPTSTAVPAVTDSTVRVLSDTVNSSSPYIFNCSLKSVYGMNGMHADGSKATGFRSMVTAQFTGISLQKDDRAFVRYDETTGTYKNQSQWGNLYSLHQDSKSIYRPEWESFHIKASNNAFIQCVSIFAIGYAKQFVADSGGDQSITNSNSNFGSISLYSKGFKDFNLSKDNHGFITHIIPPKEIVESDFNINTFVIDAELTKDEASSNSNTRIYLKNYDDQFTPPNPKIKTYFIGAKDADKLYYLDANTERQATISPNYETKYTISSISSNTITATANVSALSVGQAVRVTARNAILPDGLEHDKVYYVESIPTSNSVKLCGSLKDVGTGNVIAITTTVGITPSGNLQLVSSVIDSTPGNVGNPIQWDSSVGRWYIGIEEDEPFIDNMENGDDPISYIKRKIDARSLEDKIYRYRYVIPKESPNASEPTSGFILQRSSSELDSTFGTDNNSELNPLDDNRIGIVRNPGIVVDAWYSGGVANVVTSKPHGLEVGNKVNIYNLSSDAEPSPIGLGTGTGFNGKFEVASVVSDIQFTYQLGRNPGGITTVTTSTASWLNVRNCSSTTYRFSPYTILSSNRSELPFFTCEEVSNDHQIYKVKVIQRYKEGSSDGIYHIIPNAFKNVPSASPFDNVSYKLSQSLDNIYPKVDYDNITSDPEATITAASRSLIGKVDINSQYNSVTKETAIQYLKDFNGGKTVLSITKASTQCTVTTKVNHGLNGARDLSIVSAGSGYNNGTYYDIPLCGGSGENATAKVVVSGGTVTAVTVMNPGSGYEIADSLILRGIPGSVNATTCSVLSLDPSDLGCVQILGSRYEGNNGIFPITSVTKNTITYTNSSGSSETSSSAVAVASIPKQSIQSAVYDAGSNTTTITTNSSQSQYHPYLPGNGVIFDGVVGTFVVQSVSSVTSFTVDGDASGALSVYPSGLTSQVRDTNSALENVSTRQFALTDGLTAYCNEAVNESETQIDMISPSGFNKGDFVQIEDEILLVTRVSGTTITAIRGVLGTVATSHPNNSLVRRIKVFPVELRRNSILRASGHTFEYTGFGPGNYSTGMPTNQDRVLSNDEILISQSLPSHGGLVVYTGMNSNGEFFIGRKKFDATTGEEITVSGPGEEDNFIDELTVNYLTVNKILDASTADVTTNDLTVKGDLTVEGDITTSGTISANSISGELEYSVSAGNGLTGGTFDNTLDKTFNLGNPSSITSTSTNEVTTSSHTHTLANGSVTTEKLDGTNGSEAVTSAKIRSGAVTSNKLNGGQTDTAPIFGARAWGKMIGGKDPDTPTVEYGGNVQVTVTKTGTGRYLFVMENKLQNNAQDTNVSPLQPGESTWANQNFVVIANAGPGENGDDRDHICTVDASAGPGNGEFAILTFDTNPRELQDTEEIYFVVFG